MSRVLELNCAVKTYAWGKYGDSSEVAQLAMAQPHFDIDQNTPYAELWMGTHPQGPSTIKNSDTEQHLLDFIEKQPEVLGENIVKVFGKNLPFLFKVLSVNKALSIQAHPTKELAKQLHEKFPDKYKDPNHKPEMAIALTNFEALCGFRPVNEILSYIDSIPELLNVIGGKSHEQLLTANQNSDTEQIGDALKNCFHNLMTCNENIVKKELTSFISRLDTDGSAKNHCLGELFLRIHKEFPGDIGCFIIYILNYIQLKPYESIFLGANVPHAYLSGDIVECMACSDNVVRAGLTIKFKDVDTLVNMLNYTCQTVEQTKFQPIIEDDYAHVYNPPVDDFTVKKILIPANTAKRYSLKSISGPSIILVLKGQANLSFGSNTDGEQKVDLCRGKVFFVPCCLPVVIEEIMTSQDLLVFQAYCQV